jgi:intracellular protein transport protein USO1
MEFFSKSYQAIRSSLPSGSESMKHHTPSASMPTSTTTPVQQVGETIDKLCDRINHSGMIEDRRASVLTLRSLSKEYQLEVGTRAMLVLIRVLSSDKLDVESVRAALETLCNVCAPSTNIIEENLGANFAEIFMKEAKHISLLLECLKIWDFHVRLQTIHCLLTLSRSQMKLMQERILEDPLGIPLLVDLLDDSRDIIRNEALLLLVLLTKSHIDLQKLVAFQNAFEKLLDIIDEEGGSDGGIVTGDCIQLISNLVKNNVSNQNHFRETNSLQKLAKFLQVFPDHTSLVDDELPLMSQRQWLKQKVANLTAMIDLVGIFVERHNPTAQTNQVRRMNEFSIVFLMGR